MPRRQTTSPIPPLIRDQHAKPVSENVWLPNGATFPAARAWLSGRMRKGTFVATAWLTLLGVAATIVGLYDAVAGTEINVRLVGSLLLATGIVLLAGAVGLLHRTPIGLSLAMIASLLGVAIGVMTFLAQAVNDEPDRRLLGWATIIIASAAAATHIRALTPPEERAKSIWSRLPLLKSAISVGVLLSIAQFWYSQIYLPTTAPPSLTLETKINKVIPRGKHLVIEGFVTIRNTSNTKVQVLASTLNVAATSIGHGSKTSAAYEKHIIDADLEEYVTERYVKTESSAVVRHGRLVGENSYFEVNEATTVPIIAWLPRGKFDELYVDAWIAVGRGKTLGIEEALPKTFRTTRGAVYRTKLPEAGWLRRLTRGDRYLRVTYNGNSDPASVEFAPGRESDPPDARPAARHKLSAAEKRLHRFDKRLRRFYGVAATSSQTAVSLP